MIRKTTLAALSVLLFASTARAADPPKEGWFNTADLSYVATSGNATTSTLGLNYKGTGLWGPASLEVNAGAVRTKVTIDTTTNARGQANDYVLEGSSETLTPVEYYFLNARYNRKLTEKFFWFAGVGWDRNTPAGIDSRAIGQGGVGHIWVDSERIKFRTDYAATVTKQKDVVENPDVDDTFVGLRASWAYLHKFGSAVTYINDFIVDENLSETSDWRGDMTNAVSVEMSNHLALKAGLRLLYDADPAFYSVPLLNSFGANIGDVLVERDNLDTIFTTSLVLTW
jgi:putative salt-induced outer membrane protein YdiY